jgi:probable DNA repair protein
VSFGEPISQAPIVKAALNFIKLAWKKADKTDVRNLVLSPFIRGYNDEIEARHRLATKIDLIGETKVSLGGTGRASDCPKVLSKGIGLFMSSLHDNPDTGLMSTWVSTYLHSLEALGWPYGREVNSTEYQQLKKFKSTLQEIAGLDSIFGYVGYTESFVLINLYCNQAVFHAETASSPINVLGILEAAGMQYDHVYFLDMTNKTWPQSGNPSPFLPLALQEVEQMPHASTSKELVFCQKMHARITQPAKTVVYGYSKFDEYGKVEPSCFVSGEPLPLDMLKEPEVKYEVSEYQRFALEEFTDPLVPLMEKDVRGGVGVLKAQKGCAFKAFAKYRLGLKDTQEQNIGLSHAEQGDIIHSALQTVWAELKTQDALLEIDPHKLNDLIIDGIDHGFFMLSRGHQLDEQLIQMETLRINTLLKEWLEMEKERAPFIVEETEVGGNAELGGMSIKYRKDRKDRMFDQETGEYVGSMIIDYKKGLSKLSGMGEALTDPQLPIQAMFDKDDISAVAYGQVRRGEAKLVGVGKKAFDIGVKDLKKAAYHMKAKPDWKELKTDWTEKLEEIAVTFVNGANSVNPLSISECTFCQFANTCKHHA